MKTLKSTITAGFAIFLIKNLTLKIIENFVKINFSTLDRFCIKQDKNKEERKYLNLQRRVLTLKFILRR